MIRFVQRGVPAVVIGCALFLPACEEQTLPDPVTPPPQTVRAVVATQPIPDFPVDVYLGIPIPLAQAGILDFTVDWTFNDTYMEVAFGNQPCTFQDLTAKKCPFVILTQGTTPKPRIITTQPVGIGTYFLYLYSKPFKKSDGTGSNNLESVALQIGLTVGNFSTPRSIPIEPIRLQPRLITQ